MTINLKTVYLFFRLNSSVSTHSFKSTKPKQCVRITHTFPSGAAGVNRLTAGSRCKHSTTSTGIITGTLKHPSPTTIMKCRERPRSRQIQPRVSDIRSRRACVVLARCEHQPSHSNLVTSQTSTSDCRSMSSR